MRPSFTDGQRLKKSAKKAVESGTTYVRRWWSNKYKRPSNDPLFESRSLAAWVREMYEDLYERRAEIETALEDEVTPLRERSALTARLQNINKILDEEEYTDDPLIDKWEAELEAGITPDLDEDVPTKRK